MKGHGGLANILSECCRVHLPDKTLLALIRYGRRNPAVGRGSEIHGVADDSVIDDYAEGLKHSYLRLTGQIGWPSLPAHQLPILVEVYSIPYFGFAHSDNMGNMGIVLSNLGKEPSLATARQRRRATAAHELLHILQMSTGRPESWLWLDEASATAHEPAVFPGFETHYPFLLSSLIRPQNSVDVRNTAADSDWPYRSAHFISYLMRRFGEDVISRAYAAAGANGWQSEAIDALAAAVAVTPPTGGLLFSQVFADYCIDAFLLNDPQSLLYDPNFRERFGDRMITETFKDYPVVNAASGDWIGHLGCRYYRFLPAPGRPQLRVRVELSAGATASCLHGELVAIDKTGHGIRRLPLLQNATDNGKFLEGCLNMLDCEKLDCAMLILVQWIHGAGAMNTDGPRYSISAQAC